MICSRIIFLGLTLCSFAPLKALQIEGKDFKVLKNKKSTASIIETYKTVSATKCVTYCAKKTGCSTINFKHPDCELLDETSGGEFQIADEQKWR